MRFAYCSSLMLVGAGLLVAGAATGVAAPIRPEKGKDEPYSKKLIGVWEATEQPQGGAQPETITVEFKADGTIKIAMGPFELGGNWKVAKEEGKTLTADIEVMFAGAGNVQPKAQAITFSIVFDDADTIVMSPTTKPDPKTLKRKK